MWLYAFITGLSPSVMRAVLMLTIVQIGWMCRRQSISVNTLAAAACICLWVDPLSLFSVSFQLSFSAVLGILLFVPYMNRVWHIRGSKLKRYGRDLVTVSLAATVGTMPVVLYHFGQVSRYFLLTNVLIIPAAYILVFTGIATLVLAHTMLGNWLAVVLKYLSSWACAYVSWIEHLPFATLHLQATFGMLVCLVAAIVFCFVSMQRKCLVWLAPAVLSVVFFCAIHMHHMQQTIHEQSVAMRGKTLYYKHAGITEQYAQDGRYTFFRFDGKDYVYAPYLTTRQQRILERYCQQQSITVWQP